MFQIDEVDYTLQLSKSTSSDAAAPAATGANTPRTSLTPRTSGVARVDAATIERLLSEPSHRSGSVAGAVADSSADEEEEAARPLSRPSTASTALTTPSSGGAEAAQGSIWDEAGDDAADEMDDSEEDDDEDDDMDMTGLLRTYTVRLGAGHRCLTLTSTVSGNQAPEYAKVLTGMEEADMEDYFLNWLVAAVEGMDDAIEQSRGLTADLKKFLDVVNHFFGATVTLLMED